MKHAFKGWVLAASAVLLLSGCNTSTGAGKAADSYASSAPSPSPLSTATIALPTPTASSTLTVEQKLEDFDYMWRIMEENYPFFEVNKRMYGEDWLANKEEYRNQIAATQTDEEFAKRMSAVLSRLHNGHTQLLNLQEYNSIQQFFPSSAASRDPWAQVLQQPQVLARYGQKPTAVKAAPDHSRGDSKDRSTASTKAALSTERKYTAGNIKEVLISPGKVAYMGVGSFEGNHMEEDLPEIRRYLTEVKDYRTLIIDIRGNGGGNNLYWRNYLVPLLIDKPVNYNTYLLYRGGEYAESFMRARGITDTLPIEELDRERLPHLPPEATTMFKSYTPLTDLVQPVKPVGYKGEIYLLVDQIVYSAAEGLAAFAKGTGFATVVGGRTGGDGLGIDPLLAALPNSGYVFRFSLEMGLNADGSCNEEVKTVPDVKVDPDTSKPLLDQPAMKKVLELAAAK